MKNFDPFDWFFLIAATTLLLFAVSVVISAATKANDYSGKDSEEAYKTGDWEPLRTFLEGSQRGVAEPVDD